MSSRAFRLYGGLCVGGMVMVLVAIGIIMGKTAGFASRYMQESRWANLAPRASATLITLVGLGLTVKAVFDLA